LANSPATVRLTTENTEVIFSPRSGEYYLSVPLTVQLPLKGLVDNILKLSKEASANQLEQESSKLSDDSSLKSAPAVTTPVVNKCRSETFDDTPVPLLERELKGSKVNRGKWQSGRATFFMKAHVPKRRSSSSCSSPNAAAAAKKLSALAPIFTPGSTYAGSPVIGSSPGPKFRDLAYSFDSLGLGSADEVIMPPSVSEDVKLSVGGERNLATHPSPSLSSSGRACKFSFGDLTLGPFIVDDPSDCSHNFDNSHTVDRLAVSESQQQQCRQM